MKEVFTVIIPSLLIAIPSFLVGVFAGVILTASIKDYWTRGK